MQLVDFSNIFFVNMHAAHSMMQGADQEQLERAIRTSILNALRSINVKFRAQYGRIVIACDAKQSWRKQEFPYYKAHRKDDRQKLTHIDWPAVFKLFDSMKKELATYTSYIVIEVDGAEGDDVIATLATRFCSEKNILISTDRDFKQLQAYTNVKQYDPVEGRMISVDDGYKYLSEHIVKGDRGDGIPNILSDDDTFVVEGKRQKKMTEKRLTEFLTQDMSTWENERHRINWRRNKKLIDLRETPDDIQDAILDQFRAQQEKSTGKYFDYFAKFRLTSLLENINDFKEYTGA